MFVQVWLPFQMQSSASYKTVKGSSGVASLLGGPTSFCPFPSLEARDIAPRKFYWSLDARRVILAHSGNKNQHSRDAGFATTTFFLQFGTVNQISRYIVQLCSNTFQSYRFANRLHKAASFLTLNGDEVVEVPDSKWQGRLRHISLETLLPRKNGGGVDKMAETGEIEHVKVEVLHCRLLTKPWAVPVICNIDLLAVANFSRKGCILYILSLAPSFTKF